MHTCKLTYLQQVEKIENFIRGFEDSSLYKIILPRRFKNIKNVKLLSLEMSNAQYGIRDAVSKIYNNTHTVVIYYWRLITIILPGLLDYHLLLA